MSGESLASKFQVLELLGSESAASCYPRPLGERGNMLTLIILGGSFGSVYKAYEKESGTIVAIKQVLTHLLARAQRTAPNLSVRPLDRPRVQRR